MCNSYSIITNVRFANVIHSEHFINKKSGYRVGHLIVILAQLGGNLNEPIFTKFKCPGGGGGGGERVTFRIDRRISSVWIQLPLLSTYSKLIDVFSNM